MSVALNNTQLQILNLFSHDQSEEDLKEIKSLLITYLADKVTREADKAFDKRDTLLKFLKSGRQNTFVNVRDNKCSY